MLPTVVITADAAGVSCVAVPGWAVVTVAAFLAGPATVRAWRRAEA